MLLLLVYVPVILFVLNECLDTLWQKGSVLFLHWFIIFLTHPSPKGPRAGYSNIGIFYLNNGNPKASTHCLFHLAQREVVSLSRVTVKTMINSDSSITV